MHAILLDGYLTAKRLAEVSREIDHYFNEPRGGPLALTLVLNSQGGETSATRELVTRLAESDCSLSAKIYRAESAAAFIALSAETREMIQNGIFRIDLGGQYIDSNMLVTPERVSDQIVAEAKQWRAAVFALLKKRGFPQNGELMTRLLARNELTLTAEECLKLGIVQRII